MRVGCLVEGFHDDPKTELNFAAGVTSAFFARNAVVLVGLGIVVLMALARPWRASSSCDTTRCDANVRP